MKNVSKNRINEEHVCIDSLVHSLRHHGCCNVRVYPEKNDPPDFWIDIDGLQYAVEITSIVKDQAYHATCFSLKDMVKKKADEEKMLNGKYCLEVIGHPDLPRRNTKESLALVSNILSFIENTVTDKTTELFKIILDQQGHLGIRKISAEGATIGLFFTSEPKWEGEVQNELQELIQEAVTSKRKKLEKKKISDSCPRIFLVLYDAYGYGSEKDAQKALYCTDGYKWFHSVFWAKSFTDRKNKLYTDSPGREGLFLYSKNDRWLTN
jgi:hypothetical protein